MLKLRLICFVLGLLGIFVVQRYFSDLATHRWLLIGAAALMAVGLILTLLAALRSKAQGLFGQSRCLWLASLWQVAVSIGVGLAILFFHLVADKGEADTPATRILLGVWLLLVIIGFFAGIGAEFALKEAGLGRYAEPKRVNRGMIGWTLIGMLLGILASVNYAGSKFDVVRDWSYLKVTEPSEATKNLVKTLSGEVTAGLFFAKDSDVAPYVQEYFKKLSAFEPRLKVRQLDKDMEPTLAESLKVRRNGVVVLAKGAELKKGERQETIMVGSTMTGAREKISKLDQEFQSAFLKLTSEKKVAYFMSGHGEWSWNNSGGEQDQFMSLRRLQAFLTAQNYRVKELNYEQGLAQGVPKDASIVFIVAPVRPYLDSELTHLAEYLDRGGSLFVALDTQQDTGTSSEFATDAGAGGAENLRRFVAERGIEFVGEPIANEQSHVKLRRSPSDVWFVFTQSYSSHISVTHLSKMDERVPFLADAAGYLKIEKASGGGWQASETVRSKPGSFNDANRNYTFDDGVEKKAIYNLAAVSEKKIEDGKSAKMIVTADASGLSDFIIGQSPANQVFFVESLNWLLGTPELSGQGENEEDIKLQHTKKEDMAIFYGSILGMPILILAIGYLATRRRKRVRREVAVHAA